MRIQTTNEIIHNAHLNGSLIEATKYSCSTKFGKKQNIKWVSIEDVINQLRIKNRKKQHIIELLEQKRYEREND